MLTRPFSAVDPPWKLEEPNSASYLQALIDPAFQLPRVMQAFDKIQAEMQLNPSNDETKCTILNTLVRVVLKVENAIKQWDNKLRGGDGSLEICIERSSGTIQMSDDDIPVAYSINFNFPNFEVGAAFIYCEMIKIFLYQ